MTASAAGGIGITTRGNGGDACLAAPQVAHGKGQGVGEWVLGRMLGRGAFGVVYKARLVPSGETVAVKTINIDGLNENELRAVENEIMMMRHLHHPNVVHYLGMEAHPKHLNIFLEYVDGGSLRKMLEKTGPLSEPHTACNTKQILEGLRHLHTRNITHRDVKGANILVCRDGSLKLADFGAAKRMGHESVCGGLKGTPHWMAPEVIRGQQMASGWFKADVWSVGCTVVEMLTADVWSVGCTVVEMLTGRMPWPNISNPMAAMYRIANGEKPPLDRDISPEASAFVDSCCSADPMQRKSVDQLMQSAFLGLAARHTHAPLPQPVEACCSSDTDSDGGADAEELQDELQEGSGARTFEHRHHHCPVASDGGGSACCSPAVHVTHLTQAPYANAFRNTEHVNGAPPPQPSKRGIKGPGLTVLTGGLGEGGDMLSTYSSDTDTESGTANGSFESFALVASPQRSPVLSTRAAGPRTGSGGAASAAAAHHLHHQQQRQHAAASPAAAAAAAAVYPRTPGSTRNRRRASPTFADGRPPCRAGGGGASLAGSVEEIRSRRAGSLPWSGLGRQHQLEDLERESCSSELEAGVGGVPRVPTAPSLGAAVAGAAGGGGEHRRRLSSKTLRIDAEKANSSITSITLPLSPANGLILISSRSSHRGGSTPTSMQRRRASGSTPTSNLAVDVPHPDAARPRRPSSKRRSFQDDVPAASAAAAAAGASASLLSLNVSLHNEGHRHYDRQAPYTSTHMMLHAGGYGRGGLSRDVGGEVTPCDTPTDGSDGGEVCMHAPLTATADKCITGRFFGPATGTSPPLAGPSSASPLKGGLCPSRRKMAVAAADGSSDSNGGSRRGSFTSRLGDGDGYTGGRRSSSGSYGSPIDVIQAAREEADAQMERPRDPLTGEYLMLAMATNATHKRAPPGGGSSSCRNTHNHHTSSSSGGGSGSVFFRSGGTPHNHAPASLHLLLSPAGSGAGGSVYLRSRSAGVQGSPRLPPLESPMAMGAERSSRAPSSFAVRKIASAPTNHMSQGGPAPGVGGGGGGSSRLQPLNHHRLGGRRSLPNRLEPVDIGHGGCGGAGGCVSAEAACCSGYSAREMPRSRQQRASGSSGGGGSGAGGASAWGGSMSPPAHPKR